MESAAKILSQLGVIGALGIALLSIASGSAEARRPTRNLPVGAERLPLTSHRSLASETLLVDQEQERLASEEEAHRRELILDESCPLILFFSNSFGGEKAVGQEIPAHCNEAYLNWRKSFVHQREERLIPPDAKKEIDKDEDYDDTANGRVRIDADGLAWYYEKADAHEEQGPATYVVVEGRGAKWEMRDANEQESVRVPARWKKSLLPQYSDTKALKKYRQTIGRSLASDEPILEGAPNSAEPAEAGTK